MFRFAYQILTSALQRGSDFLIEQLQALSDILEGFLQLECSFRLMDGSAGFFHGVSDVCEWFLISLQGDIDRPLWLKIVMLPILVPYWMGSTILAVLSHPFSFMDLETSRLSNFYWGIPSIVAMALTLATGIHASTTAKSIDDRYRNSMIKAMAIGNFELAKILGGRLVSDRPRVDPETRFYYALALQKTGDMQRYQAVLASLAPSDAPGYAPAHQMRAMIFAEQLKDGSNKAVLKQLRWHLDNSGSELSADVERLWTAYYVTIGQLEEALEHLENAAKIEPRNLISLANLYAKAKNKSGENRALRAAETYLERRLKDDPLSHDDHIQLAIAQARLDKPDLAEETVLRGVKLLNDARMRRSAAAFYVLKYDVSVNENPADVALQFGYLEKALKQDSYFGEIYERMILLCERSRSNNERENILELFKSMLAAGKSVALTHFALSGVYHTLGDNSKAQFHLDQSYRMDPNYPLVTNNLAWMIAHSDQPDLTRAYSLVEKALSAKPSEPKFRDTLATILIKQGKTHEAIAEFEAILSSTSDEVSIHRKLVELYQKLDRQDMAKIHLEKANGFAKKVSYEVEMRKRGPTRATN